ncbi:MAG: class I SAM-dependent methyltransferase [Planctomycetota bacterium]
MAIRQILGLIKLFGFRRLWQMYRRHEEALPYVRGYCTSAVLWALLKTGVLDEMKKNGPVDLEAFADTHHLNPYVLETICEYLDGIRVLKTANGAYELDARGRRFMEEPRGLFDLLAGYEEVLFHLLPMLRNEKIFGKDVFRRGDMVAKGSGELGRQLPFPVLQDMIRGRGYRSVMDLGCGDAEFLIILCEKDPNIQCHGFDYDEKAVHVAKEEIQKANMNSRVSVFVGDMFDLQKGRNEWPAVDAFTAVDVFHEYLFEGPEKIAALLKQMKETFPETHLLVAEFCKQPHEKLRKRPTAFLEHHLLHNLTNQKILSASEWEGLFEGAGYVIDEKRIFDMVGHGYYALR